jgi:hypothetical protein
MRTDRSKRNPLDDLAREMRTAAAQIETAQARRVAAREADKIPLTKAEKAHGYKGKMARLGRQQMRALPDLPPEQFADAVSVLRGCADAILSRFEVTSEIHLGRKGRSSSNAAA